MRRLVAQDLIAQGDALAANEDARAGNQPDFGGLLFATERALILP
jgi:hypothetical protein